MSLAPELGVVVSRKGGRIEADRNARTPTYRITDGDIEFTVTLDPASRYPGFDEDLVLARLVRAAALTRAV